MSTMSSSLTSILTLSLFSLVLSQGTIPCHKNKGTLQAWNCAYLTLPSGLCEACPLKPVSPTNGHFVKCDQIYDLDAPTCKPKLQEYVTLNQCDDKRKSQVAQWTYESKMGLDYFIYSICEECCDCIPHGAQDWMYAQWNQTHTDANPTLFKAERGNCAAHAYYDICNVLPNVKFFRLPNGPYHHDWPPMCPYLTSWINSPASNSWWAGDTVIVPELKRAMINLNVANECKVESVWKTCRYMEDLQNRI